MPSPALSYAAACCPRPQSVGGWRVRPLELGHALLLSRRRSPFAAGWSDEDLGEIGFGDLAFGLWACSRRSPAALAQQYRRRARLTVWLLSRALEGRGGLFALAQFRDYLEAAWAGPSISHPESTNVCRAPVLALLMVTLQAHFGLSRREALETPIRVALWERAAWLETQGVLEFVDAGRREEIADALQFAREVAEGKVSFDA